MDEHVWLSLKNAIRILPALRDALVAARPEHAEVFTRNAENYLEKLRALDAAYEEALGQLEAPTLLFADRFPFRYLADDYGITCYAAFSGCSAETEASFETVAFLSKKADELNLKAILTLEKSDARIAQAVLRAGQNPDRPVLSLDSMQSVNREDINKGVTYLGIMTDNLHILQQAL